MYRQCAVKFLQVTGSIRPFRRVQGGNERQINCAAEQIIYKYVIKLLI